MYNKTKKNTELIKSDTYLHNPVALYNMGLVVRNPVFRVSDKASFKPVSLATETS